MRCDESVRSKLGAPQASDDRHSSILKQSLIPRLSDQNPCAHLRKPMDMILHG